MPRKGSKSFQYMDERDPTLAEWIEGLPNGSASYEIREKLKLGLAASRGNLSGDQFATLMKELIAIQDNIALLRGELASMRAHYDATRVLQSDVLDTTSDSRDVVVAPAVVKNLASLG